MRRLLKTRRRAPIILWGLTFLMSAGCPGQMIKSLADLSALRNELIKEYKVENVNVTVQNTHVLGISFINSSFNNLGEQERGRKAREIALFAKSHYPSMDLIDKIWVSFVESKDYVIFHYTNGLATYVFDKGELSAGDAPGEMGPRGAVTASYNPASNQTSVYLNQNLQVYSEGGSGIMLFPHFTLSGDNISTPRIATPQSVTLDFSTYSQKRMFPKNPKLIVYVDGQRVVSGSARTTNLMGSDAEKSVNEFLSLEISYEQFRQLADGKRVKFNLGAREFELTAAHLEALRAMKRCVEELKCA